jgi:outer membrane protein assembly factor BamD (BamD/ComL family)
MAEENMEVEVLYFKNQQWISVDSFIIYLLKNKDAFSNPKELDALVKALERCKNLAK